MWVRLIKDVRFVNFEGRLVVVPAGSEVQLDVGHMIGWTDEYHFDLCKDEFSFLQ